MEARDPALNERPDRALRRRTADLLGLAPALLVLIALFGGALLGAAKVSLIPLGGGLGDASLERWTTTLTDPAFLDSVAFTLRIALISTAVAAALGVGLAFAPASPRWRRPCTRGTARADSSPSRCRRRSRLARTRAGSPTAFSAGCRSTSSATARGSG